MTEPTVFISVLDALPKNAVHHRAWLEMIRCFSIVERVLMHHFAQHYDSSLPRYDVLTALALAPESLTMGKLASLLLVTKGNITGVVRRLKEDGLVKKTTSKKDRRIQTVSISAKGRRLWDKMHKDYDRIISQTLSGQSIKEIKLLTRVLEQTRVSIEAKLIE